MAETTTQEVENYLTNNPGFIKEWLCKNVSLETCQEWYAITNEEKTKKKEGSNLSLGSSPSSTEIFKNFVAGNSKKREISRPTVQELRSMNETDRFMELIRDIADELDINTLCHKILMNVSVLTQSDRGSLFLVRGPKDKRVLVSKLFDVTANSTVEDSLHSEEEQIKVPFGTGIAGHVAHTKETVNIKDAYEDPRFNKAIDEKTGFKTHSILCMPILNRENEVIGVAQIINKISNSHEFTEQDEEVFRKYLIFCGIGIQNAQLFEMSVLEYHRNQMLLSLARSIFEEQTNMEILITKIMTQAYEHQLIKCERCCVYILDFSTVQDYSFNIERDNGVPPSPVCIINLEREEDLAFGMMFQLTLENSGQVKRIEQDSLTCTHAKIAKRVASTGMTLNITDFEFDTEFNLVEDTENGFKTRNMLCMPIFNSKNEVVGVSQLINKPNRRGFTENDINIFEAFAIFCGLGIHNTLMYENACKLMAKRKIALEVLSYHASASLDETDKLKKSMIPEGKHFNLYSFDFNDFPLSEQETLQATIRMFLDFDLINKFHIPYEVICRWALSVKKNYRQVTYHNWRHAFNVAQTMFTMLKTGGLIKYTSDLEVLTLLVACLCHDLDHRGTNNTFQVKSASPLAQLYSTSVMEHHHFDHCIMILNSEGNNIFQFLSPVEYQEAMRMLEHAILSTDLALYFKKRGQFEALVKEGEKSWENPNSKDLLKSMMMTACDVAAITKPWEIQKEVAELVASEFFEQGDLERDKFKETPIAMMDREKKDDLPKMQVGFIDFICLPVYKLFAELHPKLTPMYDGVQNNRANWQSLADQNESKVTEMKRKEEEKKEQGNKKAIVVKVDSIPTKENKSARSESKIETKTDMSHEETETESNETEEEFIIKDEEEPVNHKIQKQKEKHITSEKKRKSKEEIKIQERSDSIRESSLEKKNNRSEENIEVKKHNEVNEDKSETKRKSGLKKRKSKGTVDSELSIDVSDKINIVEEKEDNKNESHESLKTSKTKLIKTGSISEERMNHELNESKKLNESKEKLNNKTENKIRRKKQLSQENISDSEEKNDIKSLSSEIDDKNEKTNEIKSRHKTKKKNTNEITEESSESVQTSPSKNKSDNIKIDIQKSESLDSNEITDETAENRSESKVSKSRSKSRIKRKNSLSIQTDKLEVNEDDESKSVNTPQRNIKNSKSLKDASSPSKKKIEDNSTTKSESSKTSSKKENPISVAASEKKKNHEAAKWK